MRGFSLLVTFLGLLAVLFVLWQHRFERSPDFPTYRITNLRELSVPATGMEWTTTESGRGIRLRFVEPDSPVAALLAFPDMPPVHFLNVRFFMKSDDLALGKDYWDDGRLIIDWHPAGGGAVEHDPVHSVRWENPGAMMEFVMRPMIGPAVPVLRLEHRGRAGELELVHFEVTVLRETWWWKIGKWFALAGWLAWACALVFSFGIKHRCRGILAAVVWLTMSLFLVVPGPWKIIRPMGSEFLIGSEVTGTHFVDSASTTRIAEPPQSPGDDPASVGKIPIQGDLSLRIKSYLSNLRQFLHLVLLVAPACVIALLVGWRVSLALSVIFSLSVEGAQAVFGYGFDWIDVADLACDGFGIGVGLLLAKVLQRKFTRKPRVDVHG